MVGNDFVIFFSKIGLRIDDLARADSTESGPKRLIFPSCVVANVSSCSMQQELKTWMHNVINSLNGQDYAMKKPSR